MKAVNLLPGGSRRRNSALSEIGIATSAIFAALAIGLVLVVAYVFLANGVTSRKNELANLQQQSTATQKEAVALKPYADLEALRESLLARVRTLADGRFDWPGTIGRLARALPADTTLTSLDGTPAGDGGGPSISLMGCTPSHDAVANVIDRLRAVDGVSSVSLQSSTVSAGSGSSGGGGGCARAEQFKLTIALAAPVAAAPAAGTAATAPPTTTTPGSTPVSPQASTQPGTGGAS